MNWPKTCSLPECRAWLVPEERETGTCSFHRYRPDEAPYRKRFALELYAEAIEVEPKRAEDGSLWKSYVVGKKHARIGPVPVPFRAARWYVKTKRRLKPPTPTPRTSNS